MIKMIQPTSKMSVSQQCLLIAKGDIDEAKKLRDYFADVMEDLPPVDLPEPTVMDKTKSTLNGILSWGVCRADIFRPYTSISLGNIIIVCVCVFFFSRD